jgi:serine/threonine protein kinase
VLLPPDLQTIANLAAMHKLGLVNGDIKDQNMLVNEDPKTGRTTAVITDAGPVQVLPEGVDTIECG